VCRRHHYAEPSFKKWPSNTVQVTYYFVVLERESDNDNGKYYKCVCITTNQPDTKSNPNTNPSPKHAAKQ